MSTDANEVMLSIKTAYNYKLSDAGYSGNLYELSKIMGKRFVLNETACEKVVNATILVKSVEDPTLLPTVIDIDKVDENSVRVDIACLVEADFFYEQGKINQSYKLYADNSLMFICGLTWFTIKRENEIIKMGLSNRQFIVFKDNIILQPGKLFTIGSDPSCDLCSAFDKTTEPMHAAICFKDNTMYLMGGNPMKTWIAKHNQSYKVSATGVNQLNLRFGTKIHFQVGVYSKAKQVEISGATTHLG